ncbi:MAG: replicative DNA helicase [Candidatus Gastranaerophilales bacterium]|nr:replicative DNA helicase [Candidatus Gastranaerophilales bacterium]
MAKNAVVKKTSGNNIIPQNLDAEEAVLGAILMTPSSYLKIADMLLPEDFYKPANRLIYSVIRYLTDRNLPVDIVTVSDQLNKNGELEDAGGRDYITDLNLNAVTSVNIGYYAQIVKETSIRRKLITAGSEIVNLAYEAESPDIALTCAEKFVFDVAAQKNNTDMQNLTELVYSAYENIEYRYNHQNELSGIETGFYDFDHLTSGLQPSTLVILAARPAMGKTALALNIAQHVGLKTDKAVAIFSLEMAKTELMYRMLSSESEVESGRIKTGKLQTQDWEKITTAMPLLSENSKIYITDDGNLTVSDIRTKCRRLKMKDKRLGLVVIDYLQLIQSNNTNSQVNRTQEVSEISRGLKILSKELEVPILALAQLNRTTESRGGDKKPLLSDLRDSGSIEQDADIVMFIHRPEYYDKENPDLKGKAQLIIAKNRSGPTKEIDLLYHASITKFKNPVATNTF